MKKGQRIIFWSIMLALLLSSSCSAGKQGNRLSIDPFVSLQSNKAIKGKVGEVNEEETYKERLTYGIKMNVHLFWILSSDLIVARNQQESQLKSYAAKDEFGEIDYEKDLGIDKTNRDLLIRVDEERRMGRLALKARLGFGTTARFMAFANAGVQAMQRIVKVTYTDEALAENAPEPITTPITYDPYAGAGFSIKLSSKVKVGATYDFFFYKFPLYEPFTREVAVFTSINF